MNLESKIRICLLWHNDQPGAVIFAMFQHSVTNRTLDS